MMPLPSRWNPMAIHGDEALVGALAACKDAEQGFLAAAGGPNREVDPSALEVQLERSLEWRPIGALPDDFKLDEHGQSLS